MKMNLFKYTWLLIFAIVVVSCSESDKNNDANYRQWLNPNIQLDDVFSINLDITVFYDDIFKVYYTEDGKSNFNENQTLITKVKGHESSQNIVFKFPKDVHPFKIRIDFGSNKKQESFKINKLNIGYQSNNFTIPPVLLFNYFDHIEDQLSFNTESHTINTIKNKDTYLPIIWSKVSLSAKLKNLKKDSSDSNNHKESVVIFTTEEFTTLLNSAEIKTNIEQLTLENHFLSVKGWACINDVDSNDTEIQLLLIQNSKGHYIETIQTSREDVTEYFSLDYNADYSGFESHADLSEIPKGEYSFGILLKNEKENLKTLILHKDKIII